MRNSVLANFYQRKQLLCKYLNSCKNSAVTHFQLTQSKEFSTEIKKETGGDGDLKKNVKPNLPLSIDTKYKIFDDKDSRVIFDVNEEQQRINKAELDINEEYHDPYEGLNLERGKAGVFEIEDLVALLKRDKAKDIFVASVPAEYAYVDYIVVATGKSQRHMQALAQFVRRVFKLKRHKGDGVPRIEGKKSEDWIALDLGNIALHIFSRRARFEYDLETLWSVGPEFDAKSKITADMNIMEQYNAFLADLQPADTNESNNKEMQN